MPRRAAPTKSARKIDSLEARIKKRMKSKSPRRAAPVKSARKKNASSSRSSSKSKPTYSSSDDSESGDESEYEVVTKPTKSARKKRSRSSRSRSKPKPTYSSSDESESGDESEYEVTKPTKLARKKKSRSSRSEYEGNNTMLYVGIIALFIVLAYFYFNSKQAAPARTVETVNH